MTVQRVRGDHYKFGAEEVLDLGATDVVLMRQDPPFDMAYITATHMLEHIHPQRHWWSTTRPRSATRRKSCW